jgi:A/G-specific adenine glycosylase
MLQQTRVAAATPYYRRFVERFPTLAALAEAREEEVLEFWSGLGYYARGRRLREAAREALARRGGLPASFDALLSLPGFGRYTAGAVASIAFGLPVPCVDGNAARVLARLFLLEGAPEDPAGRRLLWAVAGELVPRERPGDFNQAVMELGATLCGRREPRCHQCPLSSLCHAFRAGRQAEVPPVRRRREAIPLDLACAVVRLPSSARSGRIPGRRRARPLSRTAKPGAARAGERMREGRGRLLGGRSAGSPEIALTRLPSTHGGSKGGGSRASDAVLLVRRPPGGLFGGLWELPSAPVPPGEDPRAALRRELGSSLGLRVVPGAAVASLERALTHRRLRLTAYECRMRAGVTGAALARPARRESFAMATAMRRLLALIQARGSPT